MSLGSGISINKQPATLEEKLLVMRKIHVKPKEKK